MKSKKSLSKSYIASLKAVRKHAQHLCNLADLLLVEDKHESYAVTMRHHLAELSKYTHEANAYHNAITTD